MGGADLAIQCVQLVKLGGVNPNASGIANRCDGCIEFGLAATGDVNVSTFCGEAFGGGQADACGAAGDQCDFAFKFVSHDVSPDY
jgi:hypothetical protein